MKVATALCLLACVCSTAWGRVVVEAPSNELEPTNHLQRSCPYTVDPDTKFDVTYQILLAQYECYSPSHTFLERLNRASDTDAFKRIFQRACEQTPQVRTCIANVAKDAEICLSAEQKKMYQTVRDFIELAIVKVCEEDDSETVAKMWGEEFKPLDLMSQVRMMGCMTGMAAKTHYKSEMELVEYTMTRYTAITEGRRCLVQVARRKGKSATNFEKFIESLLSGMKCISPDTHEIVLCRSLESTTSTELTHQQL